MREWIKRSDQEPPAGQEAVLCWASHGNEMAITTPKKLDFTHWMPLPDPPPSTVTIEISEEDARAAEKNTRSAPNGYGAYMRRIGDACRRALEGRD